MTAKMSAKMSATMSSKVSPKVCTRMWIAVVRSPAGALLALLIPLTLLVNACGDSVAARPAPDGGGETATLRLNEIMSNDDGTAIDEEGEVGDWIELVNAGTESVELADFALSDGHHPPHPLPQQSLAAGDTVLFWADQSPEQGDHHLDFRSSRGEHIVLTNASRGVTVDEVVVGPLALNQAYGRFPDGSGAFARCNYATPARLNGAHCGPPKPPIFHRTWCLRRLPGLPRRRRHRPWP